MKAMSGLGIGAVAAALAFSTAVAADGSGGDSHRIIVTATRIGTPVEQIGGSTSVLEASAIAKTPTPSAVDALRTLPGLQFTQQGGPGKQASVFLRAANANHTLVLVDGVRINNNTDGAFNLAELPVESIERIEVLRGAQSAVYGSDAIGGVINIITRKGTDKPLGGSLAAEIGTKGHHREVVGLSAGNQIADVNSTVSYYSVDGFTVAPERDGNSEDDPHRRFSAHTNVGLNFLEDGRLDLSLLYTRNDTELDAFDFALGRMADDPDQQQETKAYYTSLTLSKPITDWYEQRGSIGHSKQEFEGRDNGMELFDFESGQDTLALQSDFFIGEDDTLTLGYNFEKQVASNTGSFADRVHRIHSVFAQNQWSFRDALFITLGARIDDHSQFDAETTYRAMVAYLLPTDTRLHASAGTGFKAPSMNDLYWPATAWAAGNPNLGPEKSKSLDLGIEQTLFNGNVVADLTCFYSEIESLIVWAETPPGSWFYMPQNVSEAEIKGVEATLTVHPHDTVAVSAFYTYTDAEDTSTGKRLIRRAENNAGASIDWTICQNASLRADYRYTGNRYDDVANMRQMGGYGVVNVAASLNVTENVEVYAKVENLFDKQYEEADGFGIIGRYGIVGARVAF